MMGCNFIEVGVPELAWLFGQIVYTNFECYEKVISSCCVDFEVLDGLVVATCGSILIHSGCTFYVGWIYNGFVHGAE